MNTLFRKVIMLAVALCCCTSAYAYHFIVDGIYYNKLSANEVEVTYKSMAGNADTYVGHVVVPETVTKAGVTYRVTGVGQMAFYTSANLLSVTLPEGIETIGQVAFAICPKLTTVHIPSTVKEIGIGAFYRCGALSGTMTLPDGITTIPKGTFEDCVKLSSVELPNTLTEISEDAFKNCKSLKSVSIPESIETVGNRAFANCIALEEAAVPGTVQHVDAEAFYNCPNIKIKKGGTAAYPYDFFVNGIYYKKLSPSQVEVTYLHKRHNDHAYAGNVVIPTSVQFEGVRYSVVAIGDHAFNRCWKLTSVTIPHSITRIGDSAFSGCYTLTTPTIPSSVQSIGQLAFNACLEFKGTMTLPEGLEKIELGMFLNCEQLTTINLPSTITAIEDNAFQGCKTLKNIVIPMGVRSIGTSAFAECASLKTINIPDGLTSIAYLAFAESGLTTITIPASVTQIHPYAFRDCRFLGDHYANVILLDKSHKGTINGYEWVDLGLPSGLKWASYNVGATKPYEPGGYYAWGEVTTKSVYPSKMPGLNEPRRTDISGNPQKDAARANWGNSWRMPTKADLIELLVNTTMEQTFMNGMKGMKFISNTNFHFIFIPYAGTIAHDGNKVVGWDRGDECLMWTSTPHEVNTTRSYYYSRRAGAAGLPHEYQYWGASVRPVTD